MGRLTVRLASITTPPARPAGSQSCYTFLAGGTFRLVWEVANVIDTQGYDALATDNVTLNGNKLYDFSSGLPSGFTGQGIDRDIDGRHRTRPQRG